MQILVQAADARCNNGVLREAGVVGEGLIPLPEAVLGKAEGNTWLVIDT